ncbi:hypothetical protein GCM10009837_06790 [Streptomyces durmitorensis]|uniref:Uncharacterized protein n=1 Tax=Streptomyces durmitorensis TaxID=319947 RepID=A0ABY4PM22_9ACTN|nr:hypothetical protein [Streptomyces durmitorensis]UQT54425.1 hypothetical protein M4V62_04585 [Streptomyces durmitorensis]
MKEDALELIATYTAIANALAWVMGIAVVIVLGFAAWVVISLGRLAFDRIGASYTRANQTIADIQQRKEEQS